MTRAVSIQGVAVAGGLALSVAMGIGRFAFTPLFPLMVADGQLSTSAGAVLAAGNYLGYFLGALLTRRLPLAPPQLLTVSLLGIALLTAAMGVGDSLILWWIWRTVAGMLSAWALVSTSSWALAWLAARPAMAGGVFAGVGSGIALAGLLCLGMTQLGWAASAIWWGLSASAVALMAWPLTALRRYGTAPATKAPEPASVATERMDPSTSTNSVGTTTGLIVCYGLFGFGYILPATYLPAMAHRLIADPMVFGWAWPLFGAAAAVSTGLAAWGLRRWSRLRLWAGSQGLMAVGVLLPALWPSFLPIVGAALLVGGTFMVITMVAMQEVRERAPAQATAVLARMTAAFALGQLAGPLFTAAWGRWVSADAAALNASLLIAATSLAASAAYLAWQAHRQRVAWE